MHQFTEGIVMPLMERVEIALLIQSSMGVA